MSLLRRSASRNDTRGFTLMEMLLVAAILPVIFFSIFANMSSGMRTWKAFNRPVLQEETVIFLDRLRTDFSGALAYTSIPFMGDSGLVSFAAPIQTERALGGEHGIGRVGYRYDESERSIIREESNLSELYKSASPRVRVALADVTGLSIEYLSYVSAESAYVWRPLWEPAKRPLPVAVRLTITRPSETLVKTFLVPSGN